MILHRFFLLKRQPRYFEGRTFDSTVSGSSCFDMGFEQSVPNNIKAAQKKLRMLPLSNAETCVTMLNSQSLLIICILLHPRYWEPNRRVVWLGRNSNIELICGKKVEQHERSYCEAPGHNIGCKWLTWEWHRRTQRSCTHMPCFFGSTRLNLDPTLAIEVVTKKKHAA